jgi:hypothetical protein
MDDEIPDAEGAQDLDILPDREAPENRPEVEGRGREKAAVAVDEPFAVEQREIKE